MPVLKRLPNGFKPRVDMVKKYCLSQISALSACRTLKDFCDYLAFSMGCDNIGVYTSRDQKVSSHILISICIDQPSQA